MDNSEEKRRLRIWAKEARSVLDLDTISKKIENKIINLDIYKSAKSVMSYHSKEIEVSLNKLLEDSSKNWYLPVVKKDLNERDYLISVPYIHGLTKLTNSNFNILEPEIVNDVFFDQIKKTIYLDLIFIPGLCFDKKGNRLGFGKGFYDNFLKLNKKSFKVGICPKECVLESLPHDLWDEKVDIVLTD